MSGVGFQNALRNISVTGVLLLGANNAVANDNGSPMTAGLIMDKMPVRERVSYVAGIVEGLAHARFLADTKRSGENDSNGMKCIYDWYYSADGQTHMQVEAAFRKYPQHYPATLIIAMLKKRCGE